MEHVIHRRAVVESLALGLAGALVVGFIVFVIFPHTHIATAFIGPGIALMGIFAHFIPETFVYSLIAEGKAPSFFAVAFMCALVFWTCTFSACLVIWRSLRGARKA